MDQATF